MSSDRELERLLRGARGTLPEPDGPVTARAGDSALAAARRRRRRVRVAAILGTCLLVAAVLAVAVGSIVAPSGTASRGPIGLGFVPEPGWQAFQTGGENGELFQTVAVASNVALDTEDQVAGAADPSGLPYATLMRLPSEGIVIVASFTRPSEPEWSALRAVDDLELPLDLGDATPFLQYGTQLRPEQPLGQYEIRGVVESHYVNVHVYFGTPEPSSNLLAEANRQLGGIVIRRGSDADTPARAPKVTSVPSAPGVVDRTVTCEPALIGGVRKVYPLARAGGGRHGSSWDRPAFAAAQTTVSGAAATAVEDNLVWVTAGRPSAEATVVSTIAGFTFPVRSWGTVAVSRKYCRTSKRIALSQKGLSGGAAGPFDERWDCVPGRRVVIRVRAIVSSTTVLSSFRGFLRTTVPVKSAQLAVATPAGKPLAYVELNESGRVVLHTAPTCAPD